MSLVGCVNTLTSVVTGSLLLLALACRAERAPLPVKPAATSRPSVASAPVAPLPTSASSALPLGTKQPSGESWPRALGVRTGPAGLDLTDVAPGTCEPNDAPHWYLRLYPLKPAHQHRRALVARRNTLPGALLCGKRGEIYLELSTAQVRQLLDAHASLRGVADAGNSLKACGWFASISPAHFVPRQLARDVAALDFDSDPKFELINDAEPCGARP
jgi:hypothetical protein